MLAGVAVAAPRAAHAQVQVSQLSDVSFGAIASLSSDQVKSQSICAFAGVLGGRYSVTASGSGTNNAFTLSNGSATLPYEVQWNASAGQSSGTNLTTGTPLTGQTMVLSCPITAATNVSLIVILRGTALTTATAGAYTGTLSVLLTAN